MKFIIINVFEHYFGALFSCGCLGRIVYIDKENLSIVFISRGRWMSFLFFECSSPFCFFVNWISLYIFPYLTTDYNIMFIIIVFWLGRDWPSGLLFSFVPSLLVSILTPLFLPSSSVSLSYSFLLFPCASVWENTLAWVLHFL